VDFSRAESILDAVKADLKMKVLEEKSRISSIDNALKNIDSTLNSTLKTTDRLSLENKDGSGKKRTGSDNSQ